MTAREAFWVALETLRSHKLRSFLTLLGVVIATTTLIVVMSIVNGMNLYIADHIANLGANTFVLHQFQWAQGFDSFLQARRRNKPIRMEDFEFLQENLQGYQHIGALSQLQPNPPARYKGHLIDEIRLTAVTPSYVDIGQEKVESGRFFDETEYRHNARVCMIGQDLVEKLFPGVDPLGKEVQLGGLPFRVVGVMEKVGSTFGQSQDNFAEIPLTTFRSIWMGRPELLVYIKAPDGPHMTELEDEVRALMRVRRRVPHNESDTFGINASDTLMSAWQNLTGTIFAVTIGLVAVFMVVGGIVIMNIMLASVTERTHEIGIRKSVGARQRDILWQFVIESGVMAALGGIAGVLLAALIARLINIFFTASVPASAVIVGVGLSTAVGLFSASIRPARRRASSPSKRCDRRIDVPLYRHNVRENLLLALDTLRTHKFRSFLTILGVLIGTTTVIAVTSIIAGLDHQLVDVAEQFGTRTLWVYKLQLGAPHAMTREERLRKPLSYDDAMAVKEQCQSVETVSVELFREMSEFGLPPVTARYKGLNMTDALYVGVTAEHLRLINATLGEGRFFTDGEDLHRRDVAVIGNGVRQRFFEHADPLGKTILVDGHSLEVVGTLTKFKSFLGDDQNDKAILAPYQSFKKSYPEAKDNFLCVLAKPGKMDQAKDEVTEVLRRRRHVKPSEPDNFGISSADSIISQFRQVIATVALVMVVISSIGLLVGGIGVMNIMLVSVTERTREIGVRKAVGARRRDITWQFLLEAMTLTASGGIIGILVGWLLSLAIRTFVPSLPSSVPLWAVVAGFSVATSIGLFFGMWPAVKAARLDPIVALRYE